jgi:hypothetical protein
MTRAIQQKPDEPFIPAAAFTKSYMEQRGAILDDYSASIWLKTAICTLESRDPVDAVSDVEALLALAKARMEGNA